MWQYLGFFFFLMCTPWLGSCIFKTISWRNNSGSSEVLATSYWQWRKITNNLDADNKGHWLNFSHTYNVIHCSL